MRKYVQQLSRTIKNIKQYLLNRGAKETFTVTPMTFSDKVLCDKTALITGGNSGIGLCIAERMSKIGAKIVITGRDKEKIKMVESTIPNCKGILWDISDNSIAHAKMIECWNCWGGIDILINNAGIYDGADIFNMTEEIYNNVMDINAKGTYFCTKAFLEQVNTVCDNKLRKIINVLSINSFVAHSNGYALSKWSGFEMTKGLANELIGRNIIVNAVAPGPTVSNITESNNCKIEGNLYNPDRHRANYFLLPDQIANAIIFLVSDISNGIVGQTIIVDGGETIL